LQVEGVIDGGMGGEEALGRFLALELQLLTFAPTIGRRLFSALLFAHMPPGR
jgi:hypothetical protein